ncbi:MAG: hypothetical protein N3I35_06345 [Clostridia bacterium]|nr:hypothetical protein [Clostridia bacterium]
MWKETLEGDDVVKVYRTREMMNLVRKVEYINEMPYGLMLKILSHFEIGMMTPLRLYSLQW